MPSPKQQKCAQTIKDNYKKKIVWKNTRTLDAQKT